MKGDKKMRKRLRIDRLSLGFFIIFTFLFVTLSLFSYGAQVKAQEPGPEGTYTFDILNFIQLQDGQFSEQYVTDKYRLDTPLIDPGAPARQRETICMAKGAYIVTQSGILLEYETDLCHIKEGIQEAAYDPDADTITIDGKIYRRAEDKAPGTSSDEGTKNNKELRWKTKENSKSNKVLKRKYNAGMGKSEHEALGATDSSISSFGKVRVLSSNANASAGHTVWRWHVGNAMKELNNNIGGIWYCPTGYSSHLNSAYWTWTNAVGDGGWIPRTGVDPSDSVAWYFGDMSSSEGCTECLMAARACFYKGLLDTIGTTAFDNWFQYYREELVISYAGNAPSDLMMSKVISSEDNLSRGDWVYFQNWVTAANCPAINPLQGENALTQNYSGAKTYIGLGIPARSDPPQPAVSGDHILNDLHQAWLPTGCPKERNLELNKGNVQTASATYFTNFSSLVTNLQNNVSLTGVSGAKGSMNQYKITVPSGVTSINIKTSGGWGDCDLYVKSGFWATRSIYDAVSYLDGNDEGITGEGDVLGSFYIMVYGYKDYGGVNLVASYQGSSEPVPKIWANGYSGAITVDYLDTVSITIGLDPGSWAGQTADWWVVLGAGDWYSFVYGQGWYSGIYPMLQYPLLSFSGYEVFNSSNLNEGTYRFYFAVDNNADGQPDATWYDYVDVIATGIIYN
jgi:hypothetical protein